jgi:hypothetical protein
VSEKQTYILAHSTARNRAMYAIAHAPEGHMVTISEPAKKRIQEEKYHAMCGDISKQCEFLGRRRSLNCWKRLLVEAFVKVLRDEAKATGKPDPFPAGEVLPSIDGLRIVQVEVLTRDFTVKQAALFIEYLYSYGAEMGVKWSDEGVRFTAPKEVAG